MVVPLFIKLVDRSAVSRGLIEDPFGYTYPTGAGRRGPITTFIHTIVYSEQDPTPKAYDTDDPKISHMFECLDRFYIVESSVNRARIARYIKRIRIHIP